MSVKSFKFVSPGIFINEIDNSALPEIPQAIGPLVIGRALRGPAMQPIKINSMEEFINVFGPPVAGGKTKDVWKSPEQTSPMYGPYAAQAYLANSAPVNYIRLLGEEAIDAGTSGYAGWKMEKTPTAGDLNAQGGAWGLFIVSGSGPAVGPTGTLGAVFYTNSGSVPLLSGTVVGGTLITASTNTFIQSAGTYHTFDILVTSSAASDEKIRFNFDVTSPQYIRGVFNTNPTALNSNVTTNTKPYFLGETYTRNLLYGDGGGTWGGVGTGGSAADASRAIILPLMATASSVSDIQWSDQNFANQTAQSGWVISQDMGTAASFYAFDTQKLFKFYSRKAGSWDNENIKISIEDIREPVNSTVDNFCTFTVAVRKMADSDAKVLVLEKFSNLNLNPASPDYIGRRIGDKYTSFDTIERRLKEYGQFDNQSDFIRMYMDPEVDSYGVSTEGLCPFGFFDRPQFKGMTLVSGNTQANPLGTVSVDTIPAWPGMGGYTKAYGHPTGTMWAYSEAAAYTASFIFPRLPLRLSSSDEGLPSNAKAYYGLSTGRTATSTTFNEDLAEHLHTLPDRDFYAQTFTAPASIKTEILEIPHIFTLDNVRSSSSDATKKKARISFYQSGSRAAETSITSDASGYTKGATTKYGYRAALLYGVDSFTMPLFGGTDGLDITEKEAFRNGQWSASETPATNYAYNTIKQAIDIVSDPESMDMNIMTVPGITNKALTLHAMNVAQERADTLAIIDLENDYVPAAESTDSFANRVKTVDAAVSSVRSRNLDNNYGCAYYPWVQIYDRINDQFVWAPPSVAALGTMANSQAVSELWFAPAGFNRGGLTDGAAGIPVTGIAQKLTSRERDDLYDVNINPIASFPAEGIVVFGQKTLQAGPSALDRINVRRLLIFLKKQVSRLATQVLFDQNIEVTWNRFIGLVDPFLRSVKARYGLEDYKMVLDKTTTTPDLVDRNIMYAKIFLKPAKSIEFIAIDFNITRAGAAFED